MAGFTNGELCTMTLKMTFHELPEQKDGKFTLLVDINGSMIGF